MRRALRFFIVVVTCLAVAPSAHATGLESATGASRVASGYSLGGGSWVSFSASVFDGVTTKSGLPPAPESVSTMSVCIGWYKTAKASASACGPATVTIDPLLLSATASGTLSGYVAKYSTVKECDGALRVVSVSAKPGRMPFTLTLSSAGAPQPRTSGNAGIIGPDGKWHEVYASESTGFTPDALPDGSSLSDTQSAGWASEDRAWHRGHELRLSQGFSRGVAGTVSVTVPGFGRVRGNVQYGALSSGVGTGALIEP